MTKPKIWYVSFENPQLTRQHVRSTLTFESEEEAKQFTRQTLASNRSVYAGTINPHTPKRLVSPDQIDEWLNAVSVHRRNDANEPTRGHCNVLPLE